MFYKAYVDETLMNPFINYTGMKTKYPFLCVIDIRHQKDHITPKKVQLSEEFDTNPLNVNARFFVLLVRHRQIEMISDGKKTKKVKDINLKTFNFKNFIKKYNLKNETMSESDLQRA